MPIRIPSPKRVDTNPESVGRLEVSAPDFQKAYAGQNEAASEMVSKLGGMYIQHEKDAMDTYANHKANEFELYSDEILEGPKGLKNWKGEPTAAFTKADKSISEKYQAILDENPDMSERAKAVLATKLDSTRQRISAKGNTIYGSIYNTYETNVTNDSVKLSQKAMTEAAERIDINDPKSLTEFTLAMRNIKDLRWNSGRKTGLVAAQENPDGTVSEIPNASLDYQISKDISEGLYQTIANYSAAGKTKEAQFMMEKYGQYIDANRKKSLVGSVEKAAKKNDAYEAASDVMQMSAGDAAEALMKRFPKASQAEVREEALSIVNSHQSRLEQMKTRANKNTYNNVANYVAEKMRSDEPFQDLKEMYRDPIVSRIMSDPRTPMELKQREAVEHLVSQPKESNVSKKTSIMTALGNGEFTGMAYADFNALAAGLNRTDRAKMETQWTRANNQTYGEQNRMFKTMNLDLKNYLVQLDYVQKDSYGKMSKTNEKKLLEAQDQMLDAIDKFPPGLSVKEQKEWVRKFATDLKSAEVFQPPERDVTPSRVQIPTATAAASTPTSVQVSLPAAPPKTVAPGFDTDRVKQKIELNRAFRKKFGRLPANPAELDAFAKVNSQ